MHIEVINGENVYVVTKHHTVLRAWAEIRQTLPESPILVTFDHHTDTVAAFTHFLSTTGRYKLHEHGVDHLRRLVVQECQSIDYHNPQSIVDAVLHLNHDEHIYAAIQAGILNHAYAITYSASSGTPRKQFAHLPLEGRQVFFLSAPEMDGGPYDLPPDRIFQVPSECAIGCISMPHTDACHMEHSAQAIETVYLSHKLDQIAEMSAAFGITNVLDHPFILDIDLDYFHSARALEPDDAGCFYDLIRRATAITIATEPTYVESERLPGETITAEFLLERLSRHFATALAAPTNSAQASSA